MISVEQVSVIRSGKRILDEVTMQVEDGELLALIGPNGAGKSTLISALLQQTPYTGTLRFDNVDPQTQSLKERARSVAFVPQRTLLQTPLPVEVVIRQGHYATQGEAIDKVVARLRLHDYLKRPFTSLSIGERQRVLIARALVSGAKHLLLDEPSSALDIAESLRIMYLLKELASDGKCIVVVLHSIAHALRFADSIALLSAGKLMGKSAPTDLSETIHSVFGVRPTSMQTPAFDLEKHHEE